MAFISSLFAIYVSERKLINKLSLFINHKLLHDDIWNDVIDYKNGTTLRIVCREAIYTGVLVGYEERDMDSWFILQDYIIEENHTVFNSEDVTYNSRLAISLKDVKRIELFYGEVQQRLPLFIEKFNKNIKTILKH